MQYKEITLTRKQLGHLLGKQITKKKKTKKKIGERKEKRNKHQQIIEKFLFSSFCPLPNSCFVFIVITALEFFHVTFFFHFRHYSNPDILTFGWLFFTQAVLSLSLYLVCVAFLAQSTSSTAFYMFKQVKVKIISHTSDN